MERCCNIGSDYHIEARPLHAAPSRQEMVESQDAPSVWPTLRTAAHVEPVQNALWRPSSTPLRLQFSCPRRLRVLPPMLDQASPHLLQPYRLHRLRLLLYRAADDTGYQRLRG